MYKALVLRDYIATAPGEFTVYKDQEISVIREENGFILGYIPGGVSSGGWLPKSVVTVLSNSESESLETSKLYSTSDRSSFDAIDQDINSHHFQSLKNIGDSTSVERNFSLKNTYGGSGHTEVPPTQGVETTQNKLVSGCNKKNYATSLERKKLAYSARDLHSIKKTPQKDWVAYNIPSKNKPALDDIPSLLLPPPSAEPEIVGKIKDIISEVIESEERYVKDLGIIIRVFIHRLEEMVDKTDLDNIFGNIPLIYSLASRFLTNLKNQDLSTVDYLNRFCDVFIDHIKQLYCVGDYCKTLAHSQHFIKKLNMTNPEASKYIVERKDHEPACKGLDLHAFLLLPMQRITRYPLLISKLRSSIPETSKFYKKINTAFKECKEVADAVNKHIQYEYSADGLSSIAKILYTGQGDKSFELASETRLLGPRLLVCEEMFRKARNKKKIKAFLFNDVLILAKPRGILRGMSNLRTRYEMYKWPIPLDQIGYRNMNTLSSVDNSTTECFFELSHGKYIIGLESENRETLSRFLALLHEYQKQAQTAEARVYRLYNENISKSIEPSPMLVVTLTIVRYHAISRVSESGQDLMFSVVDLSGHKKITARVDMSKEKIYEKLSFYLLSPEDKLKISLYVYRQFSPDIYIGSTEMNLENLISSKTKITNEIVLNLNDAPSGSVIVRLNFGYLDNKLCTQRLLCS